MRTFIVFTITFLIFFLLAALFSRISGEKSKSIIAALIASILLNVPAQILTNLVFDAIERIIATSNSVSDNPPPSTTQAGDEDLPKIGSIISFGNYEQDNNLNNGTEPIEWIVLDTNGDRVFALSKLALDCQPYNATKIDTTWSTSTLRHWMNSVFYNAAFSAEEQEHIEQATVSADPNPRYSINSGFETNDRVFLLSLREVEEYFAYDSERICNATPYAISQGAYVNSATAGSWWMLRTPGDTKQKTASVDSDGNIDYDGGTITSTRGVVRPAMWITVG